MKQENTRQRILNAALELFAQYGYEAVSVGQIAEAVGIKAPSLYKHFKSKQDIFDSILAQMEQLDAEHARQYTLPEGTAEEMADAYQNAAVSDLIAFSKAQFRYWTEESFSSCFRRMLTLEQFRDQSMGNLYQQYLGAGPLGYVTDLLENLGFPNAELLAAELYGPMHLLYSCYDGAEDRKAVYVLLDAHLDAMEKKLEELAKEKSCE